ncbi:MAG: hypothetical protein A2Y25_04825 [Candidatus Melainabacteria bacterium GWF2_37_15]|nr:MAG: hypothetical protein A2Y25_04825 [Candidatus Melainabacteria bacterium GWF2_37_15]
MKTININLIGEYAKTVKTSPLELEKDTLDSKTRFAVIAIILGTLITLALSFGVWLIAKNMAQKSEMTLNKLKTELAELQQEEAALSAYQKDLENKKKIAKIKLRAQEQINSLFIPWSQILDNLTVKVPKHVIITDITKVAIGKNSNKLEISGVVSAKVKPITAISFLILNINEDVNSLLTNAKIVNIKYGKEADLYEFQIETELRPQPAPNTITEKTGINL